MTYLIPELSGTWMIGALRDQSEFIHSFGVFQNKPPFAFLLFAAPLDREQDISFEYATINFRVKPLKISLSVAQVY